MISYLSCYTPVTVESCKISEKMCISMEPTALRSRACADEDTRAPVKRDWPDGPDSLNLQPLRRKTPAGRKHVYWNLHGNCDALPPGSARRTCFRTPHQSTNQRRRGRHRACRDHGRISHP